MLGHLDPSEDRGDRRALLLTIFRELSAFYGPQHWWPSMSGSPWEIMLGAVLTQRTTWHNAAAALENLPSAWGVHALTDPKLVLRASEEELLQLIRPAGYFRAKSRKLKALASFVEDAGGVGSLARSAAHTEEMRRKLLSVWGIGPETADAMLLYAFGRPIFVADAYALRLASRCGLIAPGASYSEVQALFTQNLPQDADLYSEYHALIVAHAKGTCRPKPRCDACPLSKPLHVSTGAISGVEWRCPRLNVEAAKPGR